MTESDYASQQLRVIRSLMEKATVYRSLSAPTAFIGGLLSLGGFGIAYYIKSHRPEPLSSTEFLLVWLGILVLTCAANTLFLARGAAKRGEPFFSSGMKCALLSVAPAFIAAGVLTAMIHKPIQLAVLWIWLYGLGLLATQHFAPRSLVVLGLAFFITGGALLPLWKPLFMPGGHGEPTTLVVSGILAATFGGYHLAYAAAVWALGEDRAEPAASTTETGHV